MARSLAWLLLALAAALILLNLDADPPRMVWRDFITDEGWWTAEARDRTLFGQWVTDEYNQGLAVPAASWVWRGAFALGGVSLLVARAPSALAALLTLLLVGLIARRERPRGALAAPLLLASALPFVFHARLAMPEAMATLGVTAAWWLLGGISRPGFWRPALAGLCLGAALSAKFSVLVMLPPLALIAFRQTEGGLIFPAGGGALYADSARARWRLALNFVFVALLAWGLLRLSFGLRYPGELAALEALYSRENLPATPMDLLANLAYFPYPTPFLYQVAPLLALAGVGAWVLGLNWRGRGPASQALLFLVLGGLCQGLFSNPADRRFLVFLPALALLGARGWAALAEGEPLPRRFVGRLDLGGLLAAAFVLAFVLPGRLAIWYGRFRSALGEPLPDERQRALAALLFIVALGLGLLWLGRRPTRAPMALVAGLLIGWLIVCLEGFDFLLWAGVLEALGRYDAGRLWVETGRAWSIPWGLATLALLWLAMARARLVPALGLERGRRWLPWLAPLLGLAILAGQALRPSFDLRAASARLAAPLADGSPCTGLIGPETATLGLGSGLPTWVTREGFNAEIALAPPSGSRVLTMIEDSGELTGLDWPRGAEKLTIDGRSAARPRFLFAVEELLLVKSDNSVDQLGR
jgi:4-amino-4-deoxy-L-arabinose transferase-like glycosyltransferase